MAHCIRCSHTITDSQACAPIFRGRAAEELGPPSAWVHFLTCCTECGALGDRNRDPKPSEHKSSCTHYERPPICGVRIEGTPGGSMPCTLLAGHRQARHRAKGRFADAVELTITWPAPKAD